MIQTNSTFYEPSPPLKERLLASTPSAPARIARIIAPFGKGARRRTRVLLQATWCDWLRLFISLEHDCGCPASLVIGMVLARRHRSHTMHHVPRRTRKVSTAPIFLAAFRVAWPPAFVSGPRNEMARRFCCRRPTSILPPVFFRCSR